MPPTDERSSEQGGAYRYYLLGILMLVYAVNFIDRQLITILATGLKRDLGLGLLMLLVVIPFGIAALAMAERGFRK
jgi:hypothetical protein